MIRARRLWYLQIPLAEYLPAFIRFTPAQFLSDLSAAATVFSAFDKVALTKAHDGDATTISKRNLRRVFLSYIHCFFFGDEAYLLCAHKVLCDVALVVEVGEGGHIERHLPVYVAGGSSGEPR